MQPPESPESWLSRFSALIGVGAAAAIASFYRYVMGRREGGEEHGGGQFFTLREAELADMRAIRALAPQLATVVQKLDVVERVVQENQSILDHCRQMLMILQRLDTAISAEEKAETIDRNRRMERALDEIAAHRDKRLRPSPARAKREPA
jgi:hypothetical protein